MYLMMADSFASQSDYESSLSYYERALIILYASTMTIARQEETTTITTQLGNTSTAQTQQGTTTAPQQTQTSTETTAQQNATSTPTTAQPAFTSTTSLIALTAIVVIALILLANTLRRTNE
jgi:hypothetical protein